MCVQQTFKIDDRREKIAFDDFCIHPIDMDQDRANGDIFGKSQVSNLFSDLINHTVGKFSAVEFDFSHIACSEPGLYHIINLAA
jgi:hypothetical protein